jgi:hypothetical protein
MQYESICTLYRNMFLKLTVVTDECLQLNSWSVHQEDEEINWLLGYYPV